MTHPVCRDTMNVIHKYQGLRGPVEVQGRRFKERIGGPKTDETRRVLRVS